MKIYDELGYLLSDLDCDPLYNCNVTHKEIEKSLEGYIFSQSGWRSILAPSKDENDRSCDILNADKIIASNIARAFFEYLGKRNPTIVLARDARPTGRALQDICARILISLGADVRLLSISSAPETMCYLKDKSDAFFYISASHNPIGYNGFKFGSNGGVFDKQAFDEIEKIFKRMVLSEDYSDSVVSLSASLQKDAYREVLENHLNEKRKSIGSYRKFVLKTANAKESFAVPFGIVADFNGSARSSSNDMSFLSSLGAKVWSVNERPGQIEHGIVPEGENLELCKKTLSKVHKLDNNFILGYVPDNDGDRGNFVFVNNRGNASILDAQNVFALIASIEMADQVIKKEKRPAIAVNGPTSQRVDEIASIIGVDVFRSDIGESNVVALAKKLRGEGYSVHVCGEGSNGGIIANPAKVRDPMNSIMSIAKLYSVHGLYALLLESLSKYKNKRDVSLATLISSLPSYTTTPAFSKDAVLRIKCPDFDLLKLEYERLFLSEVNGYLTEGLAQYEIRQYEGTNEEIGIGIEHRPKKSQGGYKVIFYDNFMKFKASLWFSKSRTEPVMRVMVDVKGDNKDLHDKLLSWQRSLVLRADNA